MVLRSGRDWYYGYWRTGQYYCDQRIQGSSYCASQCPTFVQEESWEPQRDRLNQEQWEHFESEHLGLGRWLISKDPLLCNPENRALDPTTRIASHASPSMPVAPASRWGEDRRIVGTSEQRKHGPHVQWETLLWWNRKREKKTPDTIPWPPHSHKWTQNTLSHTHTNKYINSLCFLKKEVYVSVKPTLGNGLAFINGFTEEEDNLISSSPYFSLLKVVLVRKHAA